MYCSNWKGCKLLKLSFFEILTYSRLAQNAPMYLTTSDMEQELDLQYHVHAALDVVEEKCLIGKGAPESKEPYLGLLYSTENHKM